MIRAIRFRSLPGNHPAIHLLLFAFSLAALMLLAGCAGGALAALDNGNTTSGVDFTMSVSPGSQTIVAGRGASFAVAFNPPARVGFVNFSVSGLPSGVQAAFAPGFDPATGTKTLNVFTTTNTLPGTSQLSITASDSSGASTTTVSLTIVPAADFTLSVTPNSQTVKPGGSASYTVNVNFSGNSGGPVALSVLGLPSGASASFDRNSISASGTATLTVTAGTQIMTIIEPMDVVGTDNSGTISTEFFFDIIPADFFLTQSVGPVEVNAGGTVTGQLTVTGLFATPGTVNLSATGLPPQTTASFSPSTVTGAGASTMNIATSTSTATGGYTLTIQGVDASGENITTLPLTVVPGNPNAGIFLSASPLIEDIRSGESAGFNIGLSASGGTLPPVTFSLDVQPPDLAVTASIFPSGNGPGSYFLSISTSPLVPTTGVNITVTATGPNGSQSINVTVSIDGTPTEP